MNSADTPALGKQSCFHLARLLGWGATPPAQSSIRALLLRAEIQAEVKKREDLQLVHTRRASNTPRILLSRALAVPTSTEWGSLSFCSSQQVSTGSLRHLTPNLHWATDCWRNLGSGTHCLACISMDDSLSITSFGLTKVDPELSF